MNHFEIKFTITNKSLCHLMFIKIFKAKQSSFIRLEKLLCLQRYLEYNTVLKRCCCSYTISAVMMQSETSCKTVVQNRTVKIGIFDIVTI